MQGLTPRGRGKELTMYMGAQTLHMHAGWEEALPMGLKKLYNSILSGQLDVAVRLNYRHSNLSVTLRSLLRLSGGEIQAMMAEPTACMAFASKYSWDEDSPQGRRFAAMCGESACLGAMLTEVSTHHLLENMNTHLYHSQDPATSKPQDSHLQTVQVRLSSLCTLQPSASYPSPPALSLLGSQSLMTSCRST